MKTSKKPLKIQCPGCGESLVWDPDSPFRPFCSQRCKDADFIGWAHETHRISGDDDYDDLFSGDISGDVPPRDR